MGITTLLVGATWPYNDYWYVSQLLGELLLSVSSNDIHLYLENLFLDVTVVMVISAITCRPHRQPPKASPNAQTLL